MTLVHAVPVAPGPGTPLPPRRLDDLTLAVRAQEGDVRAFEELVRRHEQRMYRLAARILGDQVEAQDVVQESLLTVWRRLPEFRFASSFSTWLYRIVSNRCVSTIRARRPDAVGVDPDQLVARTPGPERVAEDRLAAEQVQDALDGLAVQLRTCWLLREVEGLGYEQIAEIMQVTPSTVRGRLARARVELARQLAQWR